MTFRLVGFFSLMLAVSVIGAEEPANVPDYGIPQNEIPQVVTQKWYDSLSFVQKIWGFANRDLRRCDLSGLTLVSLSQVTFSGRTQWPDPGHLAKGFDPRAFSQIGLDPGLGVGSLHKSGITGKGVVVAVIDKPIRSDHQEFSGRMIYHDLSEGDPRLHFHGLACASNMAGRSCGVAPEAVIHYFAVPDNGKNVHNYAVALKELLRVNASLPAVQKIRVVSISDGIPKDDESFAEFKAAAMAIDSAGVIIVNSNRAGRYFLWGGCPPYSDREKPENYVYALMLQGDTTVSSRILVPADYRTTAGNFGTDDYMFWGAGGFSWAMPYVGGLYALALQVEPTLTQPQMDSLLVQTATVLPHSKIINPHGFISAVEGRKSK